MFHFVRTSFRDGPAQTADAVVQLSGKLLVKLADSS